MYSLIPVPKHWFQIVGIDFGREHPFAATRNAWDKDNDVWYVVASYCEAKATPPIHVAAIKPRGELDTLRMAAWRPAARQRIGQRASQPVSPSRPEAAAGPRPA